MVKTDFTFTKVVEPRELFIEPMGYEVTERMLQGYAKSILE